jgi:hypothetical protein
MRITNNKFNLNNGYQKVSLKKKKKVSLKTKKKNLKEIKINRKKKNVLIVPQKQIHVKTSKQEII